MGLVATPNLHSDLDYITEVCSKALFTLKRHVRLAMKHDNQYEGMQNIGRTSFVLQKHIMQASKTLPGDTGASQSHSCNSQQLGTKMHKNAKSTTMLRY